MVRVAAILGIFLGVGVLALGPSAALSQQTVKAGKGEKVCRVKMKYSGQVKTWVCKKGEPCCAWHEINYVKCGSTVTGCL
jgi:hypothetical protein